MATFSLGNVPSPIAQAAKLAQLRELQNPNLALERQIQQAIQLQQLQQQSPEGQLALQLKQAQLDSALQNQAFEQQRQPYILDQIRQQMDPTFKAQQNAANLGYEVDRARQLAQVAREFEPVVTPKNSVLSPGQRLIDPQGKEIASVPTTDKDSKTISVTPGSKVIDAQGNLIFDNPAAPKNTETVPVLNPVSGEIMGFVINGKFESNKKLGTGSASGAPTEASKEFLGELSKNAINTIDDLNSRTSRFTTGLGSLTKIIPETPAANYAADLETLASDIRLGILQQMKSLSKTGASGLGALSDREGKVLESSLGSIRQDQSPANVKKNLKKIKESVAKWNQAVSTSKDIPRVISPVATPGINSNAPSPVSSGNTFEIIP